MSKRISHARTYSSDKIADDVKKLNQIGQFRVFDRFFLSEQERNKKTFAVVTNEDGTPAVTPST
jgi:hypothetical protein